MPRKRPHSPAVPDAHDQLGPLGLRAGDRLAAGAHDREKRLDAVNPVPEQVGVVFLEMARAIDIATDDITRPWRCDECRRSPGQIEARSSRNTGSWSPLASSKIAIASAKSSRRPACR